MGTGKLCHKKTILPRRRGMIETNTRKARNDFHKIANSMLYCFCLPISPDRGHCVGIRKNCASCDAAKRAPSLAQRALEVQSLRIPTQ